MNEKGQITNVLPLVEARAKKSWTCNALCKVDDPILIDRYEKFKNSRIVTKDSYMYNKREFEYKVRSYT